MLQIADIAWENWHQGVQLRILHVILDILANLK
jgi:hypothetical protein